MSQDKPTEPFHVHNARCYRKSAQFAAAQAIEILEGRSGLSTQQRLEALSAAAHQLSSAVAFLGAARALIEQKHAQEANAAAISVDDSAMAAVFAGFAELLAHTGEDDEPDSPEGQDQGQAPEMSTDTETDTETEEK